MSFWIELHCDARQSTKTNLLDYDCPTMGSDSPGVLVDDAAYGASILRAQARTAGWRRRREGWHCPACDRARSTTTAGDATNGQ